MVTALLAGETTAMPTEPRSAADGWTARVVGVTWRI